MDKYTSLVWELSCNKGKARAKSQRAMFGVCLFPSLHSLLHSESAKDFQAQTKERVSSSGQGFSSYAFPILHACSLKQKLNLSINRLHNF